MYYLRLRRIKLIENSYLQFLDKEVNMKKILILFIFFMLKNMPSYGFDLAKTENSLLKLSTKNCHTDNNKLLSFPDIYHSQYNFGACELAFVNNPSKYAKTYYHYLRSFAFHGRLPQSTELGLVDKYYLPENPSNSIQKYPKDTQDKILKERALSGDASSLMTLTTLESFSLSNKEILRLSNFDEIELLQLLLLDKSEIVQKIDSWDTYQKYIKIYIENLHRISSYFRDKIGKKLIDLAISLSDEKQHATLFVQSLPFNVASNLLTLANFVTANTINEDIYWALMIRLYSPREKASLFELGIKEPFYQIIKKNIDFQYYNHLTNLNNILSGNEVYGLGSNQLSVLIIALIQDIERRNPSIRNDYIQYFPLLKSTKILDVNPLNLQDIFADFLKNKNNAIELDGLQKKLLLSDIKVIAQFPYILEFQKDFIYLEDINYENNVVKKLINDISNPLEKISFYMNNSLYYSSYDNDPSQKIFFGSDTKKIKDYNKQKTIQLIKRLNKKTNNACFQMDKESCKLLWRSMRVGNLGYGAFLENSYYRLSNGKDCIIRDGFENFVIKMAKHGAVISELFGACSYTKLQNILSLDKNNFFKKIPFHLTSLGFTGGKAFSNSEDLVTNGGGILASALHQSRYDDRIIRIPGSKGNLGIKNEAKSSQFISYINSLKFPVFNEKDFGYVDYTALSQFYKFRGNYERALRSTIKYLEQNIKDGNNGDLQSQILAFHDFATIKNLLRNLETPEELINIYLRDLYKKIKFDYNKIRVNDFVTGSVRIKGKWITDFTKNYLTPNKKIDITTYLKSFNQEKAFLFAGNLLGLPLKRQQEYCENKNFREKLIKLIRDYDQNTKIFALALIGIDRQYVYEFQNINSYCEQLYFDDLISNNKREKIEKEFSFRVNKGVVEGIKSRFDYTDPRNLQSLLNFSLLSRETKSLQGNLLSVVVLKHSYETLAKSFFLNNSNSLRIKQKLIEKIIINISHFINNYEPQTENEVRVYNYIKTNLDMLESSSKILITSDSTRKRYLSLLGSAKDEFQDKKIKEDFSYKNYLKLKKYFNKIDKELESKENIIEIINTKAKYPDHDQYFFKDFYSSFNNLIWVKDQNIIKSNKVKILSISSSDNQILVSTVSSTKIFQRNIFDVDKTNLKAFKNEISKKSYLDEDDFKLGCSIFSEIHQKFDFMPNEFLATVSSVNLFPIPLSIILGTACKNQNIPIIYASDINASIEFTIFGNKKTFPKNFIGVGNPIITEDTFEIEIPGLTRSSTNKINDFDYDFLPLPDASEEIIEVGRIFDNNYLFLEEKASISKALIKAENNNYSAIVLATHGVPFDLAKGYKLPSLLSIESDRPTLLSSNKINQFDLKQSTVFLSACDTAAGLLADPSMYLTGFTESFANAGSNLIVASLWPVVSKSSKNYSIFFFETWKKSNLINGLKAAHNSIKKDINRLPFITIYP